MPPRGLAPSGNQHCHALLLAGSSARRRPAARRPRRNDPRAASVEDDWRFPVRLTINTEQFLRNSPPQAGRDSEVQLRLDLTYEYPLTSKILIHTRSSVTFPQVRSPQFSIRSIGVKKAELINTRFLVRISVNNPNIFPVDLSSFNYALYNRDRYWAGGSKNDVLRVPAGSSAETDLSLVMNFINMGRGLLDEVVDMRQVDYRFAGTAVVDTGLAYLPRFQWAYDQSGRSAVIE